MSIARSDILRGVHLMIDFVQDVGDKQDYYKFNHLSANDFRNLARVVAVWVQIVGIEVKD